MLKETLFFTITELPGERFCIDAVNESANANDAKKIANTNNSDAKVVRYVMGLSIADNFV